MAETMPRQAEPKVVPHETSDAHVGGILWAMAVLVGIILVTLIVARGIGRVGPVPELSSPSTPRVRLEVAPQDRLAAYRSDKKQILERLEWATPQHRIAHIPIEDAIDLLAAQAQRGERSAAPKAP